MKPDAVFRAAARCWEHAGHFDRAAERYARADAWADAGRCWAQAGHPVDAAGAYACAGEPISEARQWLTSPWPERSRRPYRQALEVGLSTAAEVEALLGLGEIELASDRAFAVASDNGRSVEALRSLAHIAAARGRPDLAARAWSQVSAWSPAAAHEVFEDWGRAARWNRSLGWGRPQAGAAGWPSREFRNVRLELVWEEKLDGSIMIYGNRGLAWSADGNSFAAVSYSQTLILMDLKSQEVLHRSVEMEAISVDFIPESHSVLVGCRGGRVVRVDASTATEIEVLKMPQEVWAIAFSPRGDRVALSSSGANLRVWSWGSKGPREMLQNKSGEDGKNPSCAWSPDGRTLAWCPGPWHDDTAHNGLYLFSGAGAQYVSAAHHNGVTGVAFSPDGRYLCTASWDRTLVIRDALAGGAVAPPWTCAQALDTAVFHPHAALMAVGGREDIYRAERPGQLVLIQFAHADSPYFKVVQESSTENAVQSLAFSPDGEHLLMSTYDGLSLFRVLLI